MPGQGADVRGIRRLAGAVSVVLPLAAAVGAMLALTGCEEGAIHLDPFSVSGRDGAGPPVSFAAMMRIGAAAHAGGDLPNAVAVYRRAAAMQPDSPIPLLAIGNTLLEMGQSNEAILAFNQALLMKPRQPEALRGLAKAYLKTGRPELAGQPLAVAFEDTPNDPKLLQLIGVADDFAGAHREAQARYRAGLELRPGDPGLMLDLALSLALTEDYGEALALLLPIATGPTGTVRDRQTLALVYGLRGDRAAAEKIARMDLDPASVLHNLSYYDTLRRLGPEARSRAVMSASAG